MYKTGHAFTYLLRKRRPATRASDLRVMRTGPVCCEPRHRRAEASSVGLCQRWRRTFWTLHMIATLKITMSKWQHCKFDNGRWLFLFSFAVNVNEQRTTAFLTEKCCYFNLQSIRCAHNQGDEVNFTAVACRISSQSKWYTNYKNRLRLAKVIVKNIMSLFYGSLCIVYQSRWRPKIVQSLAGLRWATSLQ